jgi:hypothetical protein
MTEDQFQHLDASGEESIRAHESSGFDARVWVEEIMGIVPMDPDSEEYKEWMRGVCAPTEAEIRMQRYMQKGRQGEDDH